MKRFPLLLLTMALVACSRPNLAGRYETQGNTRADEAKFQILLELEADGAARMTARSNLGNPAMDQKVAGVMSIANGRWTLGKNEVTVTGIRADDGKTASHRFALDANGDLVWKENGARFRKSQ